MMTSDQKKDVLRHIRAGHGVSEALAMVGISGDDFSADAEFMRKAEQAFAQLTSRLKENLLSAALENSDAKLIAGILEERRAQQQKTALEYDRRFLARALLTARANAQRELGINTYFVPAGTEVLEVPPNCIGYVVEDTEIARAIFGEPSGEVLKPHEEGDTIPDFSRGSDEMGDDANG